MNYLTFYKSRLKSKRILKEDGGSLNLKTNKNGLFSKEQVNRSGLPIYDFTKEDDVGIPFEFLHS